MYIHSCLCRELGAIVPFLRGARWMVVRTEIQAHGNVREAKIGAHTSCGAKWKSHIPKTDGHRCPTYSDKLCLRAHSAPDTACAPRWSMAVPD